MRLLLLFLCHTKNIEMRYYCCTTAVVVVVGVVDVDVCSTLPTPLLFVLVILVVVCLAQYVAMFVGCQHEIYGFTST